ncbi:MAG: hypothetical protein QXP36_11285 [Conexivisphaerales archaeon]
MTPLKCTLFSKFNREEKIDIFFSTTWCRDRLFTSENPNDILKFYNTFSSRNELIQWMEERPKGRAEIIEVEGDKEIIVVIPTADFNGKYAKECRENIFKGLHIIFVESGFPKDPYFNYAHNCNVGIKKAMEYNPKWIVVSNDDMYKIDDIKVLVKEIQMLDSRKIMFVYTKPSRYHSYPSSIGRKRFVIGSLGYFVNSCIHRYPKNYLIASKIARKYKVDFVLGPRNRLLARVFLKDVFYFTMTSDFMILNEKYAEQTNGSVFNEGYINGTEDHELSIIASIQSGNVDFIDYRIGDYIGSTLGVRHIRVIRDVANYVYFNYRLPLILSKGNYIYNGKFKQM